MGDRESEDNFDFEGKRPGSLALHFLFNCYATQSHSVPEQQRVKIRRKPTTVQNPLTTMATTKTIPAIQIEIHRDVRLRGNMHAKSPRGSECHAGYQTAM